MTESHNLRRQIIFPTNMSQYSTFNKRFIVYALNKYQASPWSFYSTNIFNFIRT